ncbi:MAG: beta-galactosidase [bacterium]
MRPLLFLSLLLAGPALGRDAVGINVHLPPDAELDQAAALGVSWIRIDNNWINVEPEEGRFRFEELDRVVDGARRRGLQVFMTLAYAPAWATEPDGDGVPTNNVPRPGTFARYVLANVDHFRGRVTHFGLWNEPNLDHFYEGSVDSYLERIVRPGAQAVREACPECRVLGPDLAGVSGWQSYLERVLRGAPDAFDVLTHHTYAAVPGVRPGLWACDDFDHALDIGDDALCFYKPGLRQVLDQAGYAGEVWLTETGYRTRPDDAGEQERQRRTVEGVLATQLATPWWTTTFFYELSDCGAIDPACDIDGYGLLRRGAGPGAAPS